MPAADPMIEMNLSSSQTELVQSRRLGHSSLASPPVLSMWLQTVKFIVKKSKCAGLA